MDKDITTFNELYAQYARDVYRFAFWLCGDQEDAKDITSETFVRVWASESETRPGSVKAYLFTIARNLFLQQRRKTQRTSRLTEENGGSTRNTEQLTEDRSALERTLKALATLPELDRTVLIMRAKEELSHEEIAAATGLSIAAVKVRLFRARAKLSALTTHAEVQP
jgi:RNA polymerase sigma-70 factor (ECF subfamily)